MAKILVAGNINIETTVRISGFPLEYAPQHFPFFGVASSVSGVGYNQAKALTTLGNQVHFLSLIGNDLAGATVRMALSDAGVNDRSVLSTLPTTCQSVILYDADGRRQGHTDLKDIQERSYPLEHAAPLLRACDLCALGNINFARGLLAPARAAGKPIAVDVHALSDLDAPYEQDFLRAADILFLSHERLGRSAENTAGALLERFPAQIIVIGMGAEGALLALRADGSVRRIPALHLRPVVNTIGAGDALFSSFLDGYLRTGDPVAALTRATRFAAWKIGVASASEGFLTAAELDGTLPLPQD